MEPGRARLHAGNQLRELDEVAAVERQVDDLAAVDHCADGGVLGLQQRGVSLDVDRLGDFADLKLEVNPRGLSDLQRELIDLLRAKAGRSANKA